MKLTAAQVEKMADIFEGIGQVMVASLVIPFLTNTFDLSLAVTGVVLALAAWITSLLLLEEKGDTV